jgi:hypothetical protein
VAQLGPLAARNHNTRIFVDHLGLQKVYGWGSSKQ